jgi:uncharacterized protein (TIGR02722 family)
MEHYRASYDATDMRKITETVASRILASPLIANAKQPPVMMIAGVENRTSEYVDTKNLTDRIRTILLQSGRVRVVNAARRNDLLQEQGYQAANVTPGQAVAIGRQLGASLMLSGSLTEMSQEELPQWRLSREKMKYYKLTLEITDLVSGEILWTTEEEFARKQSVPVIGW